MRPGLFLEARALRAARHAATAAERLVLWAVASAGLAGALVMLINELAAMEAAIVLAGRV